MSGVDLCRDEAPILLSLEYLENEMIGENVNRLIEKSNYGNKQEFRIYQVCFDIYLSSNLNNHSNTFCKHLRGTFCIVLKLKF